MDISIIVLVFVSAFAGTITGFGTSTILVPFLLLWFTFPATLLFVGIIHWFGDIWKMIFFKRGIDWKLILLFGIPGIMLSYPASKLPSTIPDAELKRVLGLFLLVYSFYIFKKPSWRLRKTNFNAILGGSLSGLFAGIFGVGGAVRSTFLSSYNLKKYVYIFTSGAIAFLIDSSRLIGYVQSGTNISEFGVRLLAVSVLISFLGAFVAKKAVDVVPQDKFRLAVIAALFIVSIRYLLFS